MERNADGTVDYGRLNQELSHTGVSMSPEVGAKPAASLAALEDIEEDKSLKPAQVPGRSTRDPPSVQVCYLHKKCLKVPDILQVYRYATLIRNVFILHRNVDYLNKKKSEVSKKLINIRTSSRHN